jgi:putative membrane protein
MSIQASTTPQVHHYSLGEVARARLGRELSNWRLWLVRIVTNGLAVIVTVLVLPGLRFERWYFGFFMLMALVFGLLNAFVKPLIQFFVLRYLVASYGFVVVFINTVMLAALAWIDEGIAWRSLFWLLLGGFIVGLLGLVLETIAGARPPIVDRRPDPVELA